MPAAQQKLKQELDAHRRHTLSGNFKSGSREGEDEETQMLLESLCASQEVMAEDSAAAQEGKTVEARRKEARAKLVSACMLYCRAVRGIADVSYVVTPVVITAAYIPPRLLVGG